MYPGKTNGGFCSTFQVRLKCPKPRPQLTEARRKLAALLFLKGARQKQLQRQLFGVFLAVRPDAGPETQLINTDAALR